MHLLSTAPLWLTTLKLEGSYTPDILQGVIRTYANESGATITSAFIPQDSELILMLWPNEHTAGGAPTPEECSQAAEDLGRLLGATSTPYTLAQDELLCLMGRRINGYEEGSDIAPPDALSHHGHAFAMQEAHFIAARPGNTEEGEFYSEPATLLRGNLQSIIYMHMAADELRQHHYAISHGSGVTELYQTHWAL